MTTLGILAAFMALGTNAGDVDDLDDLRGLGKKHPWVASGLTLMLFSLAGIPITAGFAAKFAVISGAFAPGLSPSRGFLPVLIASVALGVVSFFYYFKLVRAMWLSAGEEIPESPDIRRVLGWNSLFVLSLCAAAVVGLGLLMRLPGMPLR